ELDALQAKINPHFLYNALNSIASLVHLDPDKAEEMTLLLSKFFRYSTAAKSQYHDTVEHELELVSTYLDVEKVRFDERLSYTIELEDERLHEALIPRFLLQPLVENAIKHGISKRAGEGKIRLVIGREGTQLLLRLHDNGPPFPETLQGGYGLQSIRDKLRLLGGEGARLELVNGPNKHVRVVLTAQEVEKSLKFDGLKV
ncbi:MAG: histidine kinase, partial [Sphingobacteriaceae bacterium]|nr:histidine kinase [Cytophagaceae bacterium]